MRGLLTNVMIRFLAHHLLFTVIAHAWATGIDVSRAACIWAFRFPAFSNTVRDICRMKRRIVFRKTQHENRLWGTLRDFFFSLWTVFIYLLPNYCWTRTSLQIPPGYSECCVMLALALCSGGWMNRVFVRRFSFFFSQSLCHGGRCKNSGFFILHNRRVWFRCPSVKKKKPPFPVPPVFFFLFLLSILCSSVLSILRLSIWPVSLLIPWLCPS